MDFYSDIPWTAVPLLAVGTVLSLLGERTTQRVCGGLGLASLLAAWGCALWQVAAVTRPASPIEIATVWGALIYGLYGGLVFVQSPCDRSVGGRGWGGMLLAVAGVVCLSASTLPVVYLGFNLLTIGLHWHLADGVTTEQRKRIAAAFRFHQACLLMTLLGMVVLYGICGTLTINEMTAIGALKNPTVRASGLALLAAVALLTGLCGYATSAVLQREESSAAIAVKEVLPPAAALIVLLRLVPPVLPELSTLIEAATVTAAAVVLVIAAWKTWTSARLTSLISGLVLLQFSMWLIGLAVGVWDSAHVARSLTFVSGLPGGLAAATIGLCVDGLACLGLAGVLGVIHRGGRSMEFVDDFCGLLQRRPVAAGAAIVCLASLCGLPPTPGFWFRWWSLVAAVSPQHTSQLTGLYQPHMGFLLCCGLLLAGWFLAIYFSLRLFGAIILDEPRGRFEFGRAWLAGLSVGPVCVAVLMLGIRPGLLVRFAMETESVPTAEVEALPGSSDRPDEVQRPN